MIRNAQQTDIPHLIPLMRQLGYPQDLEDFRQRFSKFTAQNGSGIAVVEQAGKIVGCVAWSKTQSLILSKSQIRIEVLIVDERSRWQGMGKKLMHHVETIAKKFSPCTLELTDNFKQPLEPTPKEGHLHKGQVYSKHF